MLCLGFRRGDDFYIDDTRCVLLAVASAQTFDIKVELPHIDKVFKISDRKSTEVMPGIKLFAGDKGTTDMVRVAFDVPRTVKIYRGDLYRQMKEEEGG